MLHSRLAKVLSLGMFSHTVSVLLIKPSLFWSNFQLTCFVPLFSTLREKKYFYRPWPRENQKFKMSSPRQPYSHGYNHTSKSMAPPPKIEKPQRQPGSIQIKTNSGISLTTTPKPVIDVTKNATTQPATVQKTQPQSNPTPAKSVPLQITPKRPTISITKPNKSNLKVSKREDGVFKFEDVKKMMKEFKEAWLKENKEKAESPKYILSDENLVRMKDQFRRYKFLIKRSGKDQRSKKLTEKITRSEHEKQMADIRVNLNKLNINKYNRIVDEMIESDSFGTPSYLSDLADVLHEQALLQNLFCNLYSLFVNTIKETLSEEAKDSMKIFLDRINENSTKEFQKEIPEDNEILRENAINHALFYGCMVMRDIFPVSKLYNFALEYLKRDTPATLEACIALIIPVGAKLEEEIPEAKTTIFDRLHEVSSNKKYPSRLRFHALDIIDVRNAKWEGIEKHFPQIYSIENVQKRQANSLSVAQKKRDEKPKIEAGSNKFAGLLDSDDEYDYQEEIFDPEAFIQQYIVDEEVSSSWAAGNELEFFDALIRLNNLKRSQKVIEVISELSANKELDVENAFNSCKDLYQRVQSDEYSDLKDAKAILGRIFARLANVETSFVDRFNEVFPQYSIDVIFNFLEELIRVKNFDLVTESPFWMECKWRPIKVSQLEILDTFACNDTISAAFPLYNALYPIYDLILGESEEEAIPTSDEILKEIKDVQEDISNDREFSVAIVEMLIERNEQEYMVIAKEFIKSQKVVMSWLEAIYHRKNVPADTLLSYFGQLSDIGYDLAEFLKEDCLTEDQAIIAYHEALRQLANK